VHVALSAWFNFAWVNTDPRGIDGGPLGFLTWTIPAIVGTFACDAVMDWRAERREPPDWRAERREPPDWRAERVEPPDWRAERRKPPGSGIGKMLAWSLVLMILGYGLSCGTRFYDMDPTDGPRPEFADSPVVVPWSAERSPLTLLAEPPFVAPPDRAHRQRNYWMMSQRAGSVSYLIFTAGFSLGLFVLFYRVCDGRGWQLGLFRTLGSNALAGYILHGAMEEAVKPFVGDDAAWWRVGLGFAVCFGVTYLVLRLMEMKQFFLRL
jgi:hypothetical protein